MNRRIALVFVFGLAFGFSDSAAAQTLLLPDLISAESPMNDWILDGTTRPGRVLLRFTSSIPNIGPGELVLIATGDPLEDGRRRVIQRVFRSDGSHMDRDAGEFYFLPDINMMAAEGWVDYRLRAVTPEGGVGVVVRRGAKPAVCIQSTTIYDFSIPNRPPFNQVQRGCGSQMGISVGYTDIYPRSLDEQWIDITGVSKGEYWLEMAVDPGDHILEASDSNNVARIRVTLDSPLLVDIPEDINNDGEIDAEDIQWVINGALGLDTGILPVDVNGDGVVDAIDIQLVINAALTR